MSETSQNPNPNPGPKYSFSTERLSTASEGFRLWIGKAWKIGVLMAKGAYLLGERRRLLLKLGDEAFQRLKSQEWKADELDQLVKQLERVTKKIDIEEKLIQSERFGGTRAPEAASNATAANNDITFTAAPKTEPKGDASASRGEAKNEKGKSK